MPRKLFQVDHRQVRHQSNNTIGSWQARDNVAVFIDFVRQLGVNQIVMFETADLVEDHSEKQVLYW